MKNRKIGAIIKNEFERSIKNKWFVILNLLLLIVTIVGINFNNFKTLLKKNNVSLDSQIQMYIQDDDNLAYEKIYEEFKEDENFTIEKVENVSEYENADISENVILLKVQKDDRAYIKTDFITKETVLASYIERVEKVLNSVKNTMVSENKNLTEQEIEVIKEDAVIDRIILSEKVDTSENTSILQMVSNYLIFFILLLCLNKIANTISQEKMSKSIEYILTSITTKEYIISKVLSMCLTVVVQFVFMITYMIIAVMLSSLFATAKVNIDGMEAVNISSFISLKTINYFIITFVFMCLTTFLQGVIQSVMSAKTTNIQEAGNATILLVTLNLILYTIVTVLVTPLKTSGVVAYILSVLPIASMYFIPAMFLIGQANVIQVIISIVILVASIPLSLILVQKPFKNAILDYSSKKNKKIEGIEKIIATREYQEKIIDRKESSKKGLIIGLSVILLVILQVVGGLIASTILPLLAEKITFISKDCIYLILMCIVFVVSLAVPYLVIRPYLLTDNEKEKQIEKDKTSKKESIITCIKYIVLSIPVMSVIQVICSFAIEKIGISSDITEAMGLFNYSGKFATILVFLEVAILPAIFEELFVRKGIYGVLRSKGAIFATIVSALVFATIHMNVTQFIFAFLVGILFAIVREKTGKLYPTMILHFISNGFATIEALFYDHITFMQIFTYAQIALNAVGFCILIYMIYNKAMQLKDKESIRKLKESLDYRKIKLNIAENLYVFRDYTFLVAVILSSIIFTAIEKIL